MLLADQVWNGAGSGAAMKHFAVLVQYAIPHDGRPAASTSSQLNEFSWQIGEKGTILTNTEAYYLYQRYAPVGGTINNGPPEPWFGLTGALAGSANLGSKTPAAFPG